MTIQIITFIILVFFPSFLIIGIYLLNEVKKMKDEYISCASCGYLVNKNNTKTVLTTDFFGGKAFSGSEIIYCHNCEPNYDEIVMTSRQDRYYKKIEVDEKGNPKDTKKH